MSIVNVVLASTSITTMDFVLPTNATVAGIQFDIGNGTPVVATSVVDPIDSTLFSYSATFTGVADGTYLLSAQAIDSLGNLIGPVDSQSVTVTSVVPTSPVPVPTGAMTVLISAE